MVALGATIASIFGTVKDKASSRAERILGWVLLLCLTIGFMSLLLLMLLVAIL